ncbi:MAG TPA: NAD(P)-binding domain-containing protein [Nanoarchaeota archaeon]|nr:NAD(P)-binding domain-containing protein [Nanoarchaeota archaeon]
MKLAIIGSGIVGQATGRYLLELGHDVIFEDVSTQTLAKLKKERLDTTTSLEDAIAQSDAAFICVPTPNHNGGEQNLSCIISVSRGVGDALQSHKGYYTVIVKSTVLPGTTRDVVKTFLENGYKKKVGRSIGLCMNPEFLTFIQSTWSLNKAMDKKPQNEHSIVIGEYDKRSGNVLENIYARAKAPTYRMSLEEAEFMKYANNFLLPVKISAWNELFLIAKALKEKGLMDIDTGKIAEILSRDPRIGVYGSVHGKAYGGPCFSKDPQALQSFASLFRIKVPVLDGVIDTNNKMKDKFGTRE